MLKPFRIRFFVLCFLLFNFAAQGSSFTFSAKQKRKGVIVVLSDDSALQWASKEVASDLSVRTGISFSVKGEKEQADNTLTIVVSVNPDHRQLSVLNSDHGNWEAFVIDTHNGILEVTGADVRGTIYGLFTLTEKLGISPWTWWADVPITTSEMPITLGSLPLVDSPAVKYRGIFLNDEDWGLLPWAAKTFEPESGNIGPATYEKVFQLLLRLKANTLWPAMHPGTRAFFKSEKNADMARRYHMNIGSSHAEPMLRNNVDEWDHNISGAFNYIDNADEVNRYWTARVQQVREMSDLSMFTLGMRGVHDSGMEGISNPRQAREVLQHIIDTQRAMLEDVLKRPAESVTQVFTPYKEVLKLYEQGLNVPEDVTIVWPDDNYGYIRKLSTTNEQSRSGGAGVYYHLSYWGRPHDYLWLSSTHPALMKFEMQRAFENGARQMWIANVGDIKPIEYNIEWFLHLGWAGPLSSEVGVRDYLQHQLSRDFGNKTSPALTEAILDYYHLAFERRPEFMGWSQTEPTTKTGLSTWSEDKIQQRLQQYDALDRDSQHIADTLPEPFSDAYFQLINYPVSAATAMNRKWLYRHLASITDSETIKKKYMQRAQAAYDDIQALTETYNALNGGKWALMMDASPRRLPVFSEPALFDGADNKIQRAQTGSRNLLNADPEGFLSPEGYAWQRVEELGYSRQAITLYPLANVSFGEQAPSVRYKLNLKTETTPRLFIATLPTHSNDYQHKLSISINGKPVQSLLLNTQGRSEDWKQGVLTNRIVSEIDLGQLKAGEHAIDIAVNQTGIVIDEVWWQ